MKLKDLIPKPINECVVATIHLNGETILAKNRDRKYSPTIEIIHELIDGVEVVYIHDTITDWSEGMNEYGIGIINASLLVHYDEIEADIATGKVDFDKDKKGVQPSYDGLKIRKSLSKHKLGQAIKSIIEFAGEDKKDVGVKGMTMAANPEHSFVIELTSEHLPVIKKIDNPKVTVRTNHGISYPETGYTSGEKRKSSLSRKEIAEKELEKVTDSTQILNVLSKQYTDDNFLNPYRRNNNYKMYTTGQIMMNLDRLEFNFRWDTNHSKFNGVVNKLPKDYTPKIKITLTEEIK
jgi:hypothetical protein